MDPLPPRTRGRLGQRPARPDPLASTPAHAGPTRPVGGRGPGFDLYPRARGADASKVLNLFPDWPLPPRTRGRLEDALPLPAELASTPAHAGPTGRQGQPPLRTDLYPRARGADPHP